MTDEEYISEALDEDDTNTLLAKVTRIEKGIEEIYKLLSSQKPATTKSDLHCNEHGVEMQWSQFPSEKTGKKYVYHDGDEGQRCFGRGYVSKG